MTQLHYNLARSWRPRRFDDVLGQDIVISMLKNSLHLERFFPAYLFAGQKGCGKTTTARIFAAALNCHASDVANRPCTNCLSCLKMADGSHPDCIEIDAASHTGVDDVRGMLQTVSFVPLLGSKKIYLIDEAHMLSKAAFNALLKTLEEPPAHALFMLATTEIDKIPGTVRSRSFHLPFAPLSQKVLIDHLTNVCEKEKIPYESEGITALVDALDGSARDALNALEQIRLAAGKITPETVKKINGVFDQADAVKLLMPALTYDVRELLSRLHTPPFNQFPPERIWQTLLQTVRAVILSYYSVPLSASEEQFVAELKAQCSLGRAHAVMQIMWDQEESFLATPYKKTALEYLLLSIAEQLPENSGKTLVTAVERTTQEPQKQALAAPATPASTAPSSKALERPTPKTSPGQTEEYRVSLERLEKKPEKQKQATTVEGESPFAQALMDIIGGTLGKKP